MISNNLIKKTLVCGIILLFVGASIIPSMGGTVVKKQISKEDKTSLMGFNPRGNILYVGGLGPSNYTTIQAAINDANNGDTVFVYDDSSPYYENLVVNKSINLVGENRDTTVIDGGGSGDVVYVSANGVNISRFTVQNNGIHYYGIRVEKSNYSTISENIITFSRVGILVSKTSYTTVAGNTITDCGTGVIVHWGNDNCTVTENTITDPRRGIEVQDIIHCNISMNTITNSEMEGILGGCSNEQCIGPKYSIIYGNTIIDSGYAGIYLSYGGYNDITYNYITQTNFSLIVRSFYCSIQISRTNHNNISWNTISNDFLAIYVGGQSYNNTIYMNNITNCIYGIEIWNEPNSSKLCGYVAGNQQNIVRNNNFKKVLLQGTLKAFSFSNILNSYWEGNYWGRPRLLPKIILGLKMITRNLGIPYRFEVDWHPAKKPYDIPQVAI